MAACFFFFFFWVKNVFFELFHYTISYHHCLCNFSFLFPFKILFTQLYCFSFSFSNWFNWFFFCSVPFEKQHLIPYFSLPCPWPHYNLKRPFDPHVLVFMGWFSILESCQVYVVLVFMGALRVNSSLNTWEIECISCEALSLFILELINYFAMIGLLGWFSWVLTFQISLC